MKFGIQDSSFNGQGLGRRSWVGTGFHNGGGTAMRQKPITVGTVGFTGRPLGGAPAYSSPNSEEVRLGAQVQILNPGTRYMTWISHYSSC